MSTDHATTHLTKRTALFRLLSDGAWHAHHELAEAGGVRYSARVLELRRLGYGIVTAPMGEGDHGLRYRMATTKRGETKAKRVKVFLEERDVVAMVSSGFVPTRALDALADAHASFDTNRERL
jgi:hypothetical protein